MELKPIWRNICPWRRWLLIVPYGIETYSKVFLQHRHKTFNRTLWNWNLFNLVSRPIQSAFNRTLWNWNCFTLIARMDKMPPFNRTLWNWNFILVTLLVYIIAFNRTLWNWNVVTILPVLASKTFNRTLWNWNTNSF